MQLQHWSKRMVTLPTLPLWWQWRW